MKKILVLLLSILCTSRVFADKGTDNVNTAIYCSLISLGNAYYFEKFLNDYKTAAVYRNASTEFAMTAKDLGNAQKIPGTQMGVMYQEAKKKYNAMLQVNSTFAANEEESRLNTIKFLNIEMDKCTEFASNKDINALFSKNSKILKNQ